MTDMKARLSFFNWTFYTVVFVLFVVFFTHIHPIVPFDSDDWYNIIIERTPYPSLDYWNPTKVFPERFEPFVAMLAGYLLTPLVGDFICALTLANALVVTLFIVIYLLSVQHYIEARFALSRPVSLALITLFILLHFVVMRTANQCNEYLFYSYDANCYYHYVIPNMLCASLVLWLMLHDVRSLHDCRTIAALIVLTYLALCSNLYSVIILIAYLGAILMLDLLHTFRASVSWLAGYLRRNALYLVVITAWGIIQWIESSGIRANSYGYLHEPLIYCLKVTVYDFLHIRYNLWFLLIVLSALAGAKLLDYRQGRHSLSHVGRHQWTLLLAAGLALSYLILLSSRVEPWYIQRGDVVFEFAFFFLLLVISAMAYLCRHAHLAGWSTPLLILVLLWQANSEGRTYKDVCEMYPPDLPTSIRISHDVVQQIREAEAAGLDSVFIRVPKYPDDENWPILTSNSASQYYSRALYKHNQIHREIFTILIPAFEVE